MFGKRVSPIYFLRALQTPAGQVSIARPTESKSGADFDIFIVEPTHRAMAHYRIQAKRLVDHKTIWQQGRYQCLDHRVGRHGPLQVDILCSAMPARCIPLYAFYNHETVRTASGGLAEGICLADAHAVRVAVYRAVRGDKTQKRIGTLLPLFFPFRMLVCPARANHKRPIATPAASLRSVRSALKRTRAAWLQSLSEDEIAHLEVIEKGVAPVSHAQQPSRKGADNGNVDDPPDLRRIVLAIAESPPAEVSFEIPGLARPIVVARSLRDERQRPSRPAASRKTEG